MEHCYGACTVLPQTRVVRGPCSPGNSEVLTRGPHWEASHPYCVAPVYFNMDDRRKRAKGLGFS